MFRNICGVIVICAACAVMVISDELGNFVDSIYPYGKDDDNA